MANTLTGKLIAVSSVETTTPTDPSKKPISKRKLFMDCTRFDPFTGERGFENTPLLEFGGKGLEKLEELLKQGLKKDDVITVTFDIQGTKYTSKTSGKQEVFTRVRPYDIELFKPKQVEQPVQQAVEQGVNNDLPF